MKIGELAQRLRVSTRTLRHYEAIGLLVPDHVDASSGHRSYGFSQLERGIRIEQLKAAGLALPDIRSVLDGATDLAVALAGHRAELSAAVRAQQRRLAHLDALAHAGRLLETTVVALAGVDVVAVHLSTEAEDLGPAIRRGIQRLRRRLSLEAPGTAWTFAARFPLDPAPAVAVKVAAMTAAPVGATPLATTRWEPERAVQATFVGHHGLLPLAYDAALTAVHTGDLQPTGTVRETYLGLGAAATTLVTVGVTSQHSAPGTAGVVPGSTADHGTPLAASTTSESPPPGHVRASRRGPVASGDSAPDRVSRASPRWRRAARSALVKGAPCQSAQRSRRRIPAMRAIRSSSAGHT